jgi:hypothetical protein
MTGWERNRWGVIVPAEDRGGEGLADRIERITRAQDAWTPHEVPRDPAAVHAEWMARPENRMGPLANSLATDHYSSIEMEAFGPGHVPEPGGLIEKMTAQVNAKRAAVNATAAPRRLSGRAGCVVCAREGQACAQHPGEGYDLLRSVQ